MKKYRERHGWKRIISLVISFAIVFNITAVPALAVDDENGGGKYVSDVYIAYGKTEKEAKNWLKEHGWEPVSGDADFNAGKVSFFDDNKLKEKNVAAVMGIRRTDDVNDAVTDMAVMNMKGGYSFPDYEAILKEKKAEIDEFIHTFIPVLKEYRKNYRGEGSEAGKKRAEAAYEMLNKYYEGGKNEPYELNDTGKPLGDLFLEETVQEGNKKGGDLQKILLEGSDAAVTMIKSCLALAADTGDETWLERLEELSEDELSENISEYVPEAKGQDIAPSAIMKFLKQRFGDLAKLLASQWDTINNLMIWYEEYKEKNGLWKKDGEKAKAYSERVDEYFDKLDEESGTGIDEDHEKYMKAGTLYESLYDVQYEGEWGDTLGDFFNPAEGVEYSDDTASFLPLAASLSKGQRAAAELVSLQALLNIGMGNEEGTEDLLPQVEDVFGKAKGISVYSGINRGIFRGGVALTSTALMEKNQNGYDPFADMWSFHGIYNITTYAVAAAGVITLGLGAGYLSHIKGSQDYRAVEEGIAKFSEKVDKIQEAIDKDESSLVYKTDSLSKAKLETNIENNQNLLNQYQRSLDEYKRSSAGMTVNARVIMGIGGALIVAAAMAKGYQLYKYYQRTFTQIPVYIVDEADIVSFDKDDEGNEVKLIQFDQFVYYDVVKCNRQIVGEIGDWQDGVSEYKTWGCGEAADLNADMGQQWLAMYTVKSERKGKPVLADSLKLKYGDSKMPEGCSRALHMFTYENAVDIGDTAYAYNNDKDGIYFFWDVDEKASSEGAASAFAGGSTAIAGGIGLLVGIVGTAIVMRKKREEK